MLNTKTFVLGQLQTNSYILISPQNNCYFIDPADDFVFLSDYINQNGLTPKGIILTHGHFDHCFAALPLKMIFDLPILASSKDLFLLKQIASSSNYWTDQDYSSLSVEKIDFDLSVIKTLVFDNHTLSIIKTPGHTPGSISIYCQPDNILFTGDTLFKQGIGRSDLSYSKPDSLKHSLKKILKLPINTSIFPGHGQSTILGQEIDSLSYLL
jgi:hydroxyacylglutathione hydrolase